MVSRAAYLKARAESMPVCSWESGCSRKVVNVSTQLCANHYQQTPQGRDVILRQKYGLQPGDYEALLKAQDYGCGICGKKESIGRHGAATRLCVDHSHTSGQVRGLLCATCNAAIGKLKDDPNLVSKALAWLQERK